MNLDFNNIDHNISIVISSCLLNQGKFNCLIEVINNLKYFLPNSEIIIGFDNIGPNDFQQKLLNEYTNIIYFIHTKGLGFSYNEGIRLSKQNIILQIEDDWIIDNKYLKTEKDVKILLLKCCKILSMNEISCVKLDGGMFDEIGGSDGYPLGWVRHQYKDEFIYYEYNLPTKEEMKNNWWLHYAFSNHPHLKLKNCVIKYPYPENIDPGTLENEYSTNWILLLNPIYYVPINEESIRICGITNPDKNIYKMVEVILLIPNSAYIFIKEYLDIFILKCEFKYILFDDSNGEEYDIEQTADYIKENIYIYVSCRIFSLSITNSDNNIGLLNTESYDRHINQYGNKSIRNLAHNQKISFLIEYSEENINNLKTQNEFNNIKIFFCPATVLNNEIHNYEKTLNITSLNCNKYFERRYKIIEKIKNNNIDIQNINLFGENRDNILMRSKIFLNIHSFDNYDILEQTKINRLIYNKVIVISENGNKIKDTFIEKYIIHCDYNNLVEKTIDVINNYEYYYNLLFNDFNVDEINNYYETYYSIFFKYLYKTCV